jgi:hypothetical protein
LASGHQLDGLLALAALPYLPAVPTALALLIGGRRRTARWLLALCWLPFGLLTLADDQITKVAFAVCLATPLGQGGLAAMAVTLATCLFLATRHRAQEPPVRPAIR